jgi:integrase
MKIAHAKLSLADRAARLQQALKSATPAPGRYADARNLYLKVSPTFAKSWVFMWQANGQQREMGLGSATGAGSTFSLTLAQARLAADKARATIAAGNNPIAIKVQTKIIAVTFRELLETTIADVVAPKSQASNREHNINQWRNSLTKHAALIMDKRVLDITVDHIITILRPIWSSRKLGELVRSRIETVLRLAKGKKLVAENVAVWHGNLDGMMAPKQKKADAKSHASLHYSKLSTVVAKLAKRDGMSAKALLNAILSGGRTDETLSMRHSELDLDAGRWVIPAERMKAGKEHVVLMSTQQVELLRGIKQVEGSDLVFNAPKGGKLSPSALRDMLNKPEQKGGLGIANSEATPHGFRATFTDWAGDMGCETEIAEMATAHSVKGVRKAYRRGTAEALRSQLMQAYADAAFGASNVVPMLRHAVAA